jgi:hypothetical protein
MVSRTAPLQRSSFSEGTKKKHFDTWTHAQEEWHRLKSRDRFWS